MATRPQAGSESGAIAALKIVGLAVNQDDLTTVTVTFSKEIMTQEPTGYEITYQKLTELGGSLTGTPTTQNFSVDPEDELSFSIANLDPGAAYRFKIQAFKNLAFGSSVSTSIALTAVSFNGKVVGSSGDPKAISSGKSYLEITGPLTKNQFAVATREFGAITLPTPSSITSQGVSYNEGYFSFGTSLYMRPTINNSKQGGGIGFFTNVEGTRGYFILIDSTSLAASQGKKEIRVVKADGTELKTIKDSQQSAGTTFDGIYGGVQYNIDVKVKIASQRVDMIIYINGFKIIAVDENAYSSVTGKNLILSPTKNVSLLASSGTVAFDYVYGTDIEIDDYENASYVTNFYEGQFSNDLLDVAYGDTIYNASADQDVFETKKDMVDEFGTTVREISKHTVKFDSRPAFPIKWSTGNNRLVKIIASKSSAFGGEAYLLNNTSTTIPVSDNNFAAFYIFGNTLSLSGELEYSTDETETYSTKEPVIFQSKWLQNESDVKSLANWIKSNVVNKGKAIDMQVFGNPLLNVGDIVSITHTLQGLAAGNSEKFIVTNINHSYDQGLETNIKCRLIATEMV
jgi:hypothetical protein